MNQETLHSLIHLFREARPAAVLTGAGISTESGIPDFRSPGTGLYSRMDPMEYLSVEAMMRRPERFWRMFAEINGPIAAAQPNAGHLALARLEEAGLVSALVTQNIDGLHHKAGSRRIIELHGHLRTARCEECGRRCALSEAIAQLRESSRPYCAGCGGPLRPDVVLFGDMLETFPEAARAVREAKMLLVAGSSLGVHPANTLVYQTERLAIVNRDPTPFDSMARAVLRAECGEALRALADALLEGV
jgi:NAD-dependent deacetylase